MGGSEMKSIEFKDLLVDHSYYCHSKNFECRSWNSFINEFKDADPDLNLVFRWDMLHEMYDQSNMDGWAKRSVGDGYTLDIHMVQQRKGLLRAFKITGIEQKHFDEIKKYLKINFDKLKENWLPLE